MSSVHAKNRMLSSHAEEAEEDAEDASAPCRLLFSCAEEDAPPSALDPCGLLSPATEKDMQRALLHSIWGLSQPLWRARRWMLALMVTTLVTFRSRKESPKHSIMIILSPLLSSLSLGMACFCKIRGNYGRNDFKNVLMTPIFLVQYGKIESRPNGTNFCTRN